MNNNTMSTDEVITLINNRIHELKYQQIGLKSFIRSDQERYEQIEFAIKELRQILKQIQQTRRKTREVQ